MIATPFASIVSVAKSDSTLHWYPGRQTLIRAAESGDAREGDGGDRATLGGMAIRRIMPYHESADFEATRAFYTRVLGLEEGDFGGGYIGFGSGHAQVLFAPPGVPPVLPDMGVDVTSREAVDAAHAQAVQAGHEVIYGPVDEPWGVRRFFVRDPNGVVISVLAHD